MNRIASVAVAAILCWASAATAPAETPLPEGTSVLPADPLGAFVLLGQSAQAGRMEKVPVEGQKFTQALRVRVTARPENPWFLQVHATTTAPVAKGDVLLARFSIRCIESMTGEASVGFVFELGKDPWTKSVEFSVSAGRTWTEVNVPFTSVGTYGPGEAGINFPVGFAVQTVEIGGISVVNYAAKVKPKDLPRTGFSYGGREPEAPWRKEAAERIEKIRKGDLAVTVRDAAGKPLAGADVTVRMTRHAFGFGSAVAAQALMADNEDARKYRDTVRRMFNKVVFENDLKWPGWEDRGRRAILFQAADWLKEQGIAIRGHCLVWPSWRYTPKDLQGLKGDPEALRKRVADHVREEAAAMKGRLVEWDVINEPFSNHDIQDVLGNEVMVEWFRIAHEADPQAELYLNDYSILSGGGRDTAHQDHFEKTLRFLIEKGAPLGGIGMQGHFGWALTPPPKMLEILDRYAALGRPIQVTEFDVDVSDEPLQAEFLRDFMTTLFSHPSVKGIVMWGFWEGLHWKPNAALFRRDWSVKPNGQAWMDLVLKQWWTEVAGKTAADGRFATRGFLGDYEVTVTAGGKTNTVRAALPQAGATVAVTMD